MLFTQLCDFTGSTAYGITAAVLGAVLCYFMSAPLEQAPLLLGAAGGYAAGKTLGYLIEGWFLGTVARPYVLGGIIVGAIAGLYLGTADIPGLGNASGERFAGGLLLWGLVTFMGGIMFLGVFISDHLERWAAMRIREREEWEKRFKD